MVNSPIVSLLGMSFNIYGVILIVLAFVFIIAYRDAAQKHGLNWIDMITKDGKKVSFSKIIQMVGGVVGTWIVVQMTMAGTITWDIFAIYLAYVASVDGFSKFITARYTNNGGGGYGGGYGGYNNNGGGYNNGGYNNNSARGVGSNNNNDPDGDNPNSDPAGADDSQDTRPKASKKTPGAD